MLVVAWKGQDQNEFWMGGVVKQRWVVVLSRLCERLVLLFCLSERIQGYLKDCDLDELLSWLCGKFSMSENELGFLTLSFLRVMGFWKLPR
jgi:hypothetical protein